jgi:MarR family transcriptional regulator for hemolysin
MRPARTPIGLELARTAKAVSRAFDDALGAAGGSLPMWLILLSLKTRAMGNQRELADTIGIQQATLTHHLNAMAESGLLTRERDPGNRRVHIVTLTDAGEAAFHRLREAAVGFDNRLRHGISENQLAALGAVLEHLASNAAGVDGHRPTADATPGGNDG